MAKKIKVVIDRARWRTGADSMKATGLGPNLLKNDEGFLCCLGFCIEALNTARGTNLDILGHGTPEDLECAVPYLADMVPDRDIGGIDLIAENTELSEIAMQINDSATIPSAQKEEQLKDLFSDSVFELEFINDYVID